MKLIRFGSRESEKSSIIDEKYIRRSLPESITDLEVELGVVIGKDVRYLETKAENKLQGTVP